MDKTEILTAIYQLGRADRQALFVDWLAEEKRDRRLMTYFNKGLDLIRHDKKSLLTVCRWAGTYIDTNGATKQVNRKRDKWLETVFTKNMNLIPLKAAKRYINIARLPTERFPEVLRDAQKVKRRVKAKQRYFAKKNGKVHKYERGEAPLNGDSSVNALHPGNGSEAVQAIRAKITAASNMPVLTVSRKSTEELERAIAPYREVFKTPVLQKAVGQLIETLGHYLDIPSVIVNNGVSYEIETRNAKQFPKWLESMKDTSLFDHTCNVVTNAIKLTRQTFSEAGYRNMIPVVVTTALAHDIGKIDKIRNSSPVRKKGHHYVSAEHLKTLFHDTDIKWLDQAVNAILQHHTGPKNNDDAVAKILFDADTKAREQEMTVRGAALVREPISKWLDLKDLARAILPSINILDERRHWQAITYGNTVYCMYGHILNTVAKLSEEKGILDYRFVRQAMQENIEVLGQVIEALRDKGYLAWNISAGRYYRRLNISVNIEKIHDHQFDLIAIRADMFDTSLSDVEARKTGYLKLIHNIGAADSTGF